MQRLNNILHKVARSHDLLKALADSKQRYFESNPFSLIEETNEESRKKHVA